MTSSRGRYRAPHREMKRAVQEVVANPSHRACGRSATSPFEALGKRPLRHPTGIQANTAQQRRLASLKGVRVRRQWASKQNTINGHST